MKKPTTEFAKGMQEKIKINRDFLLSQGWELVEEKPLFETYHHPKNKDLICSIGLYGNFSIQELHWLNRTPERGFFTWNPNLTLEDYFKIFNLLNIQTPQP